MCEGMGRQFLCADMASLGKFMMKIYVVLEVFW